MSGELVEKLTAASQYGMCDGYWPKDEPEAPFQLYAEAAAELTRLRSLNAELVEVLSTIDASWTEECPGGPEGDRKWCHGLGEIADSTIQIWRRIRAALSRVSGGGAPS